MKNLDNEKYSGLILREEKHFENFMNERRKKGIHIMHDLRRGKKMTGMAHPILEDNPLFTQILLGGIRKRFIEKASQFGPNILEIGCGGGWLSLELARLGMDVEALDLSAYNIAVAEKILMENPYKAGFGSLKYRCVNAEKGDIGTGRYDTVVMWNSLHHFYDIRLLLRKVALALKPEGRLIVFEPGIRGFRNKLLSGIFRMILTKSFCGLSMSQKWAKVINRVSRQPKSGVLPAAPYGPSPFDRHNEDLLPFLKRAFHAEYMETTNCFGSYWFVTNYNIAAGKNLSAIRLLKLIDSFFIRIRLVRGAFFFGVFKK